LVDGNFKTSFFAISLQWCLPGLDERENNKFASTRIISFLVLSVMHLALKDCITSGLQLSGITRDATEVQDCSVGVKEEVICLAGTLDATGTSV